MILVVANADEDDANADERDAGGVADADVVDDAEHPDDDSLGRRMVDSLLPHGAWQIAIAVLAVSFLAGAVGYTIGTRNTFPTSDVDVGFLLDMSDHHDQAVQMALCTTNRATESVTREFAKETLVFQAHDLGMMQIWLEDRGQKRPTDPDRPAMGWMSMTSTAKTMPGMATEAQVDSLCAATGREADRLFLTLMRDHHLGGVHMADYAAEHAASPEIREFARVMGKNQAVEGKEYTATLKRLGLE